MNNEVIIILKCGNYIHLQFSDAETEEFDCDSCIDYTIYDQNKTEIDGGLMEYNSLQKGYDTIEKAIDDVIDFAYDEYIDYVVTNLLLEDEFMA